MPPEWSDFDVSSLAGRERTLGAGAVGVARRADSKSRRRGSLDGTLLQVGKSTENREELLDRFRTIVALVSVAIVLTGLVRRNPGHAADARADPSPDYRGQPDHPYRATPKRACRLAPTATRSTS